MIRRYAGKSVAHHARVAHGNIGAHEHVIDAPKRQSRGPSRATLSSPELHVAQVPPQLTVDAGPGRSVEVSADDQRQALQGLNHPLGAKQRADLSPALAQVQAQVRVHQLNLKRGTNHLQPLHGSRLAAPTGQKSLGHQLEGVRRQDCVAEVPALAVARDRKVAAHAEPRGQSLDGRRLVPGAAAEIDFLQGDDVRSTL